MSGKVGLGLLSNGAGLFFEDPEVPPPPRLLFDISSLISSSSSCFSFLARSLVVFLMMASIRLSILWQTYSLRFPWTLATSGIQRTMAIRVATPEKMNMSDVKTMTQNVNLSAVFRLGNSCATSSRFVKLNPKAFMKAIKVMMLMTCLGACTIKCFQPTSAFRRRKAKHVNMQSHGWLVA